MFLLLFTLLGFIVKEDKGMILLFYLIGVSVVVFFYTYWINFYGNSYFLGRKSDDWQYDVYWTKGFVENYGVNLFKIDEHLNGVERGLGFLHNSKGYVGFVIVMRWFSCFFDGYHTLIPRVFNVFVLILTAYYSSLIAFYYTNNKKVRRVVLFTVFFFPVMLFNSVHVFRDTIISFLLVILFYTLLKNKYSIFTFLKIIIFFFIMYYLRTSTFFVSFLMILIMYINPKRVNFRFVVLGFIFFLIATVFLNNFVFNLTKQISSYGELNTERFGRLGSGIFELPLYIGALPRVIYMIFTPVPNFSGFHQIFVSITAFIQVFYFPYLFLGVKSFKIDFKLKLVFLLFFLGVAFSTATFRHVMMYIPFGIIITTISYFNAKNANVLFKHYFKLILILFLLFIFSIMLAFVY